MLHLRHKYDIIGDRKVVQIMENELSVKIKTLRTAKGMTLEQVAEIVGVGKSTVRKWETGMIANMKRDKIALLAKALSTTPAYLMGWKEEPPKEINLSDGEKALLELFRKVPDDKQKMLIQMIQVALNT